MRNKILQSCLGLLLFGGIFYFFRGESYSSKFEVMDQSGSLPRGLVQDFSGILMVNLDAGSDLEILVASRGGPNKILKLVDQRLVEFPVPELQKEKGETFSAGACDLDGDGRDEILLINHPTAERPLQSQIYRFSSFKWLDIIAADESLRADLNRAYSVTCIDRKGNGKFGFAVASMDGETMFLELVQGRIMNVAKEIGLAKMAKGRSITGISGLLGRINIFQGNEGGANFYFINDGTGNFKEEALATGLSDANFDARGAFVFDENSDELPDLIYGNHFGPTRIMKQNRDGSFKDVTPEVFKKEVALNTVIIQDLNLDGEDDLFGNVIRGANLIYGKDSGLWFQLEAPLLVEKELFGIASLVGDLDGRPGVEMINTHGDGKAFPLTMYSILPQGHWLKLSLRLKNGGIPRGATVIVKTNQRQFLRFIGTGTGRFGELHPDLVFGLKESEEIVSIDLIKTNGERLSLPGPFKKDSVNLGFL